MENVRSEHDAMMRNPIVLLMILAMGMLIGSFAFFFQIGSPYDFSEDEAQDDALRVMKAQRRGDRRDAIFKGVAKGLASDVEEDRDGAHGAKKPMESEDGPEANSAAVAPALERPEGVPAGNAQSSGNTLQKVEPAGNALKAALPAVEKAAEPTLAGNAAPQKASGDPAPSEAASRQASAPENTLTLTGRVEDEEGQPLVGAQVILAGEGQALGILHSAKTGSDGRFSIDGLHKGTPRLEVRHAGFTPYIWQARVEEGSEPLRIALARGAVLSGKVVDAAGAPVPLAKLSLARSDGKDGFVPAWRDGERVEVLSGQDGGFLFSGLPGGDFALMADGGPRGAAFERISVEDGGHLSDREIKLAPAPALEGLVVDEEGAPLEGAQVELRPGGVSEKLAKPESAVSGADGAFRFPNLVSMGYVIFARHAKYYMENERRVVHPGGSEKISLPLKKKVAVRGRLQGPKGEAVEPFALFVLEEGQPARAKAQDVQVEPLRAGEARSFSLLLALRPGRRVSLQAEAEGFGPATTAFFDPRGAGNEELKLTMSAARTFELEVSDSGNGMPIPGARVDWFRRDGPSEVEVNPVKVHPQTDELGRLALKNLSDGRYLLSVYGQGYANRTKEIRIGPETARVLKLELYPGATLKGIIRDRDMNPLENWIVVAVSIESASQDPGGFCYSDAPTERDGAYRFENLPPGICRLQYFPQNASEKAPPPVEVSLKAGEEKSLDLGGQELELTASLKLTATHRNLAAQIILESPNGERVREAPLQQGACQFDLLAPGAYRVLVKEEEGVSYALSVVLAASENQELPIDRPRGGVLATVLTPDRTPLHQGFALLKHSAGPPAAGQKKALGPTAASAPVRDGFLELAVSGNARYDLLIHPEAPGRHWLLYWLRDIDITVGQPLALGSLSLKEGREVILQIHNRRGEPVAGARAAPLGMEFVLPPVESEAESDAQGRLSLDPVPLGTLSILVSADDYAPAVLEVKNSPADMTLLRGGEVSVQIQGALEVHRPLRLLRAVTEPGVPVDEVLQLSANSDRQGKAVFRNVPPGIYRAVLPKEEQGAQGFAATSREFAVEDEAIVRVEIPKP